MTFFKFILSGAVSGALTLLFYTLLNRYIDSAYATSISAAVSYLAGAATSFSLQAMFVFRTPHRSAVKFARFLLWNGFISLVVGYATQTAVAWLEIPPEGIASTLVFIAVVLLFTPLSFIGNRRIMTGLPEHQR